MPVARSIARPIARSIARGMTAGVGGVSAWAIGMDLFRDFTVDRGNLPALTDTHADTINVRNAAGVWVPKAANVVCQTDAGLQTVPSYQQFAAAPQAPATQVVTLATPGTYTLWIEGPGSIAVTALTAIGTGFGSASAGAAVTFIVSTGGTVTLTVTGVPTLVQVINKGFVLPPIYSASSVTGNLPIIMLPTQLALGVAGVIQFDNLYAGLTGDFGAVLSFGLGNNSDNFVSVIRNQALQFGASITVATVTTAQPQFQPPPAIATYTMAFAFSNGFSQMRMVGSPQPTAGAPGYPAGMDRLALGNQSAGGLKAYQRVRKLGLKFGPQDQSTFDTMYQRALAA